MLFLSSFAKKKHHLSMRIQWGPTPGREAEMIAAAHALACVVYPSDIVLTQEILNSWLSRNPKILWFALDDNERLLGYVYGLSLTPQAFQRIFEPNFDERTFKPEEIMEYKNPGTYQWFLCSLVVHPDHQRTTVGRSLRKKVLQDLASLAENGIVISQLAAETVSEGGVRCMPAFGMSLHHQHATHSSSIYHAHTSPAQLQALAAKL